MPKINLDKTIHAGGKVFFAGEASVSDEDEQLIKAEQARLAEIESEEKAGTPKKSKTKTDK